MTEGLVPFSGVDLANGIDEAIITISYRGVTWYVRGVPFDAELTATVADVRGLPLPKPVRELVLRLREVEFETEGSPRLIP